MRTIFRGSVNKGQLVMGADYIDTLAMLEGQDIDLTICKHKTQRSLNQNSYFHGVIVKMISDETGYEIEEVKEMIRMKFLSYEIKLGDEIVLVGRSTVSLTTAEFEELNSQCRRWAAQAIGLYLPEPNEVELN